MNISMRNHDSCFLDKAVNVHILIFELITNGAMKKFASMVKHCTIKPSQLSAECLQLPGKLSTSQACIPCQMLCRC